jgi:hypothetical protein
MDHWAINQQPATCQPATRVRHNAKLTHQAEVVVAPPVLGDLAVGDPQDVDAVHRDLLAGRRDAEELAEVGAGHGRAGDDLVPFRDQVVDPPIEVGEGTPEEGHDRLVPGDPLLHPRRVGVIEEVGRDDRVGDGQVSPTDVIVHQRANQGLVLLRCGRHLLPPYCACNDPLLRSLGRREAQDFPRIMYLSMQEKGRGVERIM